MCIFAHLMLRITSAEFVISAARAEQFPTPRIPELAFVGRSNVGKSSLLNALVGRRDLAKTSSTPGKTRQLNFFRINDKFHLVDLPGYGYAKVAQTEREAWARLIERYLREREQLRLVVSLVDIRHDPTALDRSMIEWLGSIPVPFLVVLTKLDKVSGKLASQRVAEIDKLAWGFENYCGALPTSAQTRAGRDRLLKALENAVAGRLDPATERAQMAAGTEARSEERGSKDEAG